MYAVCLLLRFAHLRFGITKSALRGIMRRKQRSAIYELPLSPFFHSNLSMQTSILSCFLPLFLLVGWRVGREDIRDRRTFPFSKIVLK